MNYPTLNNADSDRDIQVQPSGGLMYAAFERQNCEQHGKISSKFLADNLGSGMTSSTKTNSSPEMRLCQEES